MAKKNPARKASSAKRKSTARPRDAIALLRADHSQVEELFEEFDRTSSDDHKMKLAQMICTELKIHTAIEEEIFYPAALAALHDADMIDEAEVEHASAKDLIAQIEAGGPHEDKWDAKVTVLGEYIKHHVKEEQTEMFPKVRKTKLDLKELGQQLLARKTELQATDI